jgi:hypothetical protein
MGTSAKRKLGHSAPMLKTWGQRARDWEKGNSPKASTLLARAVPKKKCDVFLFVINGAEEKNPAAAQGIIAGLRNWPRIGNWLAAMGFLWACPLRATRCRIA